LMISITLAITHSRTHRAQITTTAPGRVVPRTASPRIRAGNQMPQRSPAVSRHGAAAFVRRAGDHQEQLPKLATFPVSSPPTAEERILARLAARRGSYEVATSSENVTPLNELSVPELNIKPLEGTPPDNVPQD
jgi:hypothetical protein